jgi:poly(3-hydroxybutyrate) depolymerase
MRVEPTSDAWVQHNACNTVPDEILLDDLDPIDGCRITRKEWTNCQDNTAVVLLWAEGSGHDWYRTGAESTTQCRDIDDTRLFWEFFEAHAKQ